MVKRVITKKEILASLSILILISFLVLVFGASFSVSPVQGGNYSGTLSLNCTTSTINSTGTAISMNATFFYNASGGATGNWSVAGAKNLTLAIGNDSRPTINNSIYNATVSTAWLTDGRLYNISCFADNGTAWEVTSVANITIDNTAPNVSAFSTTVNEGNYSGTIVLNASVSDTTIGVDSVYFNVSNSTGFQFNFTKASNVSAAGYNISINTAGFGDGIYNVTVYANDSLLNNLNSSQKIKITMDNTAPNVSTFFTTVNGGNYTNTTLVLNVSVSDATIGMTGGFVYFNISNSSGGWAPTNNWTQASNVTGGYYNLSLDAAAYPDGKYNVTVIANDSSWLSTANINNSERIQITIDKTAPYEVNFTSTTVTRGNYSGTVVVNVSVLDTTAGVNTVFFNITNSSGQQNATLTASKIGNYFNASLATTQFPDGTYNITVWSNDSSGNSNRSAVVYSLKFDNTAPNVTFSGITNTINNGNYTNTTLVLNVSVSDTTIGMTGGFVYFNISNSSGGWAPTNNWTQASNVTGGYYNLSLDAAAYPDGKYNITVIANDSFWLSTANINNSERIQITIDKTAPNVSAFSTTVNNGNYSGTITLNVSASDTTIGVESVYFNVSNSTGFQFNFTKASNVSAAGYNISINTAGFRDGLYNITVHANDTQVGNLNSSQKIQITIDNTAPIVNFTGITNTVNNGNYSGTMILNVSASDATMGVESVYFNVSNSTGFQFNFTKASNSGTFYNLSVNIAGFRDGLYNATAWVNDTQLNNLNSSTRIQFTIDNTAPYEVNFTSTTVTGGNYSGTVLVNVSVLDTTAGVNTVFFNITNSSGQQNATLTASRTTGNYFNASLATTQFPDGTYNITVWSNDSSGNSNRSAVVYSLKFDNTAPTATVSCTPASVVAGATVTCTCSPSDATSGINSSATSITANPSTVNTGSHTSSCSFKDLAGNSGTASTTYNVELGSSSGSGSSGSSGTVATFTYAKTISKTAQEFSEIKKIETSEFSGGGLKVKERVKIKIDSEEHYVGVKEVNINTSSVKVEIASDPVQVELKVGEDTKIDVNADDYYDVYVKLNGISGSAVDLTIEYIKEAKAKTEEETTVTNESSTQETTGEEAEITQIAKKNLAWLYWIVGIIAIIIIIWVILKRSRKESKGKKRR